MNLKFSTFDYKDHAFSAVVEVTLVYIKKLTKPVNISCSKIQNYRKLNWLFIRLSFPTKDCRNES